MTFWETSAIEPLCVVEPASAQVRGFAEADPSLVVWWATRTERISVLARRRREGRLGVQAEQRARRVLASLASAWSEILPSEAVRGRGERLLSVHPLRAAAAFQLAAALVWSRGATATHSIVSFDDRLREAARREGFQLLPD